MDLNFSKQKYEILLSPRAFGDIEYKQRKNWSSKNKQQRERANVMFDRIHQALYNIANCTNFNDFPKSSRGEYQYTLTDGFAVINFELYKTADSLVVYVTNFLWPYKKDPNSWWYIVENMRTSTNKVPKVLRLTESDLKGLIIESVSRILEEYEGYKNYAEYAKYRPIGKKKFQTEYGNEIESVVTLKSESGQMCHIVEDDHCYVLYNQLSFEKEAKPVTHIFPDAFEILKKLPNPQ